MTPGTTIKSIAQVAGVECPKETGEMKKDGSCWACKHFSACIMALPPELRVISPSCPECNKRMLRNGGKEYNKSTAEWRQLYLCPNCGAWWERRTDLEKENKSDDKSQKN